MTINNPRRTTPNRDSLTYLGNTKPTTPIGELLKEVQKHNPPGRDKPRESDIYASKNCKKCSGTGWVESRNYPGRWVSCKCVTDNMTAFNERIAPKMDNTMIGLTDNELEQLKWKLVIDDPRISDGGRALAPMQALFKRGHGLLFLWGSYGQAKTLLGKIAIAEAYRSGRKGAYADVSKVMDNIRLSFDAEHQGTELLRRMDWWIGRDVLTLDELGRVNLTDWTSERLFQLLDARYTRAIREQALTIIISNKQDGGLDGYMKSRLNDRRLWIEMDGKEIPPVIHLNGKDGRQSMPNQYHF